jgi:hypothetical protein
MFHKFLLALVLSLGACPALAGAHQTSLVGFDLSLAGYRLGMSYDDAARLGAFRFEQPATENPVDNAKFYAVIDSVDVEGVDMNLRLSFRNDRVYKIVARISPGSLTDVLLRFQQTLGAGDDISKVFRTYDGREVQLNNYRWQFPNAARNLVESSCITDYATIGLVTR